MCNALIIWITIDLYIATLAFIVRSGHRRKQNLMRESLSDKLKCLYSWNVIQHSFHVMGNLLIEKTELIFLLA